MKRWQGRAQYENNVNDDDMKENQDKDGNGRMGNRKLWT